MRAHFLTPWHFGTEEENTKEGVPLLSSSSVLADIPIPSALMARLALVSCTIEKLRTDSAFRALSSSLASKSREVEGDEGNKKRSTSTSTRRASRRRRRRGTSPSTQRSGDEEEEPEALIEQTGEVEDNEAALSPTSRS